MRAPMIVLFTDFGPAGPYVGQMKAVLHREAPHSAVVDLVSDAPSHDPMAAAYLLAACVGEFAEGTVFLCVVDPGVGTGRLPLVVEADGRRYVGPDNGLFEPLLRRAATARAWQITWRPERLSASFHGRDLFAPVAARLARGEPPPGPERAPHDLRRMPGAGWPDDLARIIYIDHYGNAVTGLRAAPLGAEAVLEAGGRELRRARHFSELPAGAAFWYENANGLAEVAVARGHAARDLGLALGAEVTVRQRQGRHGKT